MLFSNKLWAAFVAVILYGSANAIGTVVGPLLIASLYTVATLFDRTGSYQPVWLLFLVLAAAILVLWLPALKLSQKYQIKQN